MRSGILHPTTGLLTITIAVSFLLVGFAAIPEATQTDVLKFTPDPNHSRIGFKVRHLGIANVRGHFNSYDITVEVDPEDLSTLSASADIDVATISTGNDRRDADLRSDNFFSVEAFPRMKFVSKEVRNIDGNEFELVGDLTIRDVTKEVVLDAAFLGAIPSRGGTKAGFEAATTINRFEYGLKWDRTTEVGGLVVSEDVRIEIELEMNASPEDVSEGEG